MATNDAVLSTYQREGSGKRSPGVRTPCSQTRSSCRPSLLSIQVSRVSWFGILPKSTWRNTRRLLRSAVSESSCSALNAWNAAASGGGSVGAVEEAVGIAEALAGGLAVVNSKLIGSARPVTSTRRGAGGVPQPDRMTRSRRGPGRGNERRLMARSRRPSRCQVRWQSCLDDVFIASGPELLSRVRRFAHNESQRPHRRTRSRRGRSSGSPLRLNESCLRGPRSSSFHRTGCS